MNQSAEYDPPFAMITETNPRDASRDEVSQFLVTPPKTEAVWYNAVDPPVFTVAE